MLPTGSQPALEPDWVPGGFHFNRVQNPIRIFRFRTTPHFLGQVAPGIPFHIQLATALELSAKLCLTASVHNRVHIHVTGDVRRKLGPISRQHVDYTARQIAGGDDFGKGQSRERFCRGSEDNSAVTAQDHRHYQRDKSKKRRFVRTNHHHHASRFGHGEIEMRARNRVHRAENLAEFIGPAGVMDQPIDRQRCLG